MAEDINRVINSESYWDNRFDNDWRERNGSQQTLFFYKTLIDYLPEWFNLAAHERNWSICDWGCAFGEGTHLLQHTFPGAVTGIDFATSAINSARETFPDTRFLAVDLLKPRKGRKSEQYDVMLSSNTLEHFSQPFVTLDAITAFARHVLVVMVPWAEYERHEEHEATFDAATVPVSVAGGAFTLVHSRIIPTSKQEPTFWWGDQLLAIYVHRETLHALGITLGNLTIDKCEVGLIEGAALVQERALRIATEQTAAQAVGNLTQMEARALAAEAECAGLTVNCATLKEEGNAARAQAFTWKNDSRYRDTLVLQRDVLAAQLRDELAAVTARAGAPTADVTRLDKEVAGLRELLATRDGTIDTLGATMLLRDASITTLVEEVNTMLGSLAGLRAELAEKTDMITSQAVAIAGQESALTQAQELAVQLRTDVAGRDDTLALQAVRLGEQTRQIESLRSALSSTGAQLADLTEQHTAQEAALAAAHDKEARLQAYLGARDDTLALQAARIGEKAGQIEMLQDTLSLSEARLANATDRHAVLAADVHSRSRSFAWRFTSGAGGSSGKHMAFLHESIRLQGPAWTLRWLAKRAVQGRPRAAPPAFVASAATQEGGQAAPAALHAKAIVIFSMLPPDDIGGGQRGAQMARTLARAGWHVHFVSLTGTAENYTGGVTHTLLSALDPTHLFQREPFALAIFEVPHPALVRFLEAAKANAVKTVFDWIDQWEGELGEGWFDAMVQFHFVAEADIVAASARLLQQKAVEAGRDDAIYLPNAGDEIIFNVFEPQPKPADMPGGRPAAVYVGSLYGSWFDWDLVAAAADAAPDRDILLIGEPPNPLPAVLGGRDNIRLLGPRPITAVAGYLSHADCALIPFKVNALTAAVNPIKLHEYALMGAPVVSTALPEVLPSATVVRTTSVGTFAAAVARPPARRKGAVETALLNATWGARVGQLLPTPEHAPFDVVVLIHNNADVIELCLESLQRHGFGWVGTVIVVDNCSTDGGPQLVAAQAAKARIPITLLCNPVNGCASGRNLALDHLAARGSESRAEHVLFLDSDQWLSSALGLSEAHVLLAREPELHAVSWIAATLERQGDVLVSRMLPRGADFRHLPDVLARGYCTSGFDYLGSGGLAVRRASIGTVRFDTQFDPTCFEDADFSRAMQAAGLNLGYRPLQGINHKPHATTGQLRLEAYHDLYRRNARRYAEKWG